MIDIHNHSRFSFDSNEDPYNCIETAIKRHGVVFGFSEHFNMFKNEDYEKRMKEFAGYDEYMNNLAKEYQDKILLVHGLEFNWYPGQDDNYVEVERHFDLDYVINSIHDIGNDSFYRPGYFVDKDETVVASEYLDCVIKSLYAKYDYQIIGHIGTLSKLFMRRDKNIHYEEFPDKFDTILKYIINHDKSLEVNTNFDGENVFPHVSILKRYYELGGRNVTLGGDAHIADRVYIYDDNAIKILKEIGFTAISYYKNKIRKEVKI